MVRVTDFDTEEIMSFLRQKSREEIETFGLDLSNAFGKWTNCLRDAELEVLEDADAERR